MDFNATPFFKAIMKKKQKDLDRKKKEDSAKKEKPKFALGSDKYIYDLKQKMKKK